MPTRRSFFSAVAVGAAALWPATGFSRRRQFRRSRNAASPLQPTTTFSHGAFPTGYQYRDSTVDLVVPNLTQWAKLCIGMTSKDVRQLLGPPLEDDSRDDPEFRHQISVELPDAPNPPEFENADTENVGDLADKYFRQQRYLSNETWNYGHFKFLTSELYWRSFGVSFVEDYLNNIYDPFGGDVTEFGVPHSYNLSHDGCPTVPHLLTPYPNAKLTHEPFILDFRWLPVCGEYPIDYELEVTAGNDIYHDEIGATKREWYEPRVDRTTNTHVATLAPGSNPCRWRVKATNRLGESDWSEYREFEFAP